MGSELDLDALLSIVRRRTPGEWRVSVEGEFILMGAMAVKWLGGSHDLHAIVAAVNAIEPLAERCKRAESEVDELKGVADVT